MFSKGYILYYECIYEGGHIHLPGGECIRVTLLARVGTIIEVAEGCGMGDHLVARASESSFLIESGSEGGHLAESLSESSFSEASPTTKGSGRAAVCAGVRVSRGRYL